MSSWVSTGPNKPVDPNALGAALGPDKVQQMAGQSGLDVGALLPVLAAALPTVIDAITPDGQVPKGNAAAGLDIGGRARGPVRGRERRPELAAGRVGRAAGRTEELATGVDRRRPVPRRRLGAYRRRRFASASTSRAAFRPGTPVTPPPGCAPDPARYRPSTGIR